MNDSQATRDERAIRSLYRSWFDAMERADVEGLLALLTSDVILKMPATPTLIGRDAVGDALREFHATHTESVAYMVEEVEVRSDLAFARISERATIRPRSGESEAYVEGMHLAVLRRKPNGTWLVSRDVSSLNRSAT